MVVIVQVVVAGVGIVLGVGASATAGAVVVYWPLSSWRLDYSGHCEVC